MKREEEIRAAFAFLGLETEEARARYAAPGTPAAPSTELALRVITATSTLVEPMEGIPSAELESDPE